MKKITICLKEILCWVFPFLCMKKVQESKPVPSFVDKVVVRRTTKNTKVLITILRKDVLPDDIIVWEKGKWQLNKKR